MVTVGFRSAAAGEVGEAARVLWEVQRDNPEFIDWDAMTVVFSELCTRLADYVDTNGSLNVDAGDRLTITEAQLQAALPGVAELTAIDVEALTARSGARVDLEISTRLRERTVRGRGSTCATPDRGTRIWATVELPAPGSSGWWVAGLFLERPKAERPAFG